MSITPAAKTLSVLKISNATGSILPIGAGVRLQPGQTISVPLTQVQDIQQMMPRLKRLAAAGKVLTNYKEIPGLGGDVAGQPAMLQSGSATVTQNVTRFVLPNYTESATETIGFVMTRAGTLRNLFALLGTAPGGTDTVTFAMMLNGVATGLTCVITGTATSASDQVHTVDVKAGDKVSFRQVSSATSLAATLSISCEIA